MKKAMNHANGQGTLYRKARDGKHYGAWIARFIIDGKAVYKSTGTEIHAEAEKRLQAIAAELGITARNAAETLRHVQDHLAGEEARIERARQEARDAAPALRIAETWERYARGLNHGTWSAETERIYENRMKLFARWMEENRPRLKEAREIGDAAAAAFLASIRDARSAKTFNDYRALLSMVWDGLKGDSFARLDGNPWEKIKPLIRDTHTRRELTVEELARVIALARGEMRTLFAIGIYTGLRLADAATLEWGAVDLVRGFIVTMPRKTARHGTLVRIPIARPLADILAAIPPEERTGAIMPDTAKLYESPNGAKYLSRDIQKVFAAAGIETAVDAKREGNDRKACEVGFHSLRHTFVSLSANAGTPLAVVQSIVGHTNAAMTTHYFHVSDNALRDAAAALPAIGMDGDAPAVPVEIESAVPAAAGDALRDFRDAVRRMDADARRVALDELRALVEAEDASKGA